MSKRLPIISGQEAVTAFRGLGFNAVRQRGSHVVLKRDGYPILLSVPLHATLKRGTLRSLISDSGFSVDEFCAACR
ncbi:MAG: type II toxin-antitoxin system HicA family toxin [Phycisphaerales bacterium]|nr:type II toxin-antitoxin system HicA family toxin [Phycisphaerales bacterium]